MSRASLHNFREVAAKDIRVGDRVSRGEKAGRNHPSGDGGHDHTSRPDDAQPVVPPHTCPECQTPVVAEDVFIYCPNAACPAACASGLIHFASKGAMDIDGMGPAVIDQVTRELGCTAQISSFELTVEQLAGLERMGAKSAESLVAALLQLRVIAASNAYSPASLSAISERPCQRRSASTLEPQLSWWHLPSAMRPTILMHVSRSSREKNGPIDGLGPTTADSIFPALVTDETTEIISGLAAQGVRLTSNQATVVAVDGIAGKTFVLTGTLTSLTRSR